MMKYIKYDIKNKLISLEIAKPPYNFYQSYNIFLILSILFEKFMIKLVTIQYLLK